MMGFPSSSKLWKKDETAALIALFETERCLYDPNDRDFDDPVKQAEAYERICKIMLRIRPNVTVDEITCKIKILRKQYEGELLHKNISIETGLCTIDSYKPGIWCFGLLQFLDDYLNVKTEYETNKNDEDSDKEVSDIIETDHRRNVEECSDVNDESDDDDEEEEELKERTCCKKRKIGSSSSSSERESHSSSVRKFISSSSEKKLKNTSFSVRKFQSSSSVEKKINNASSTAKKTHSSLPSEKKIQKTPSVLEKSQNPSFSFNKIQNASSLQKKVLNSSPSLKKISNVSSSERKVPSSNYEKSKKSSSSSERELDTSSVDREPKNNFSEKHFENESSVKDLKNSFSAAKETNINSFQSELFNASFDTKFDVTEKIAGQSSLDREDIFGRYVACELRALRCHPLLYLQTKQSILESLNSANFELLNPE